MDLADISQQLIILMNKFAISINQMTMNIKYIRIKAENFGKEIYFKIERVRGKTEKENFDSKKILEDGASNDRLSKIFSISKSEQTGAGAGKRHGHSIEHFYRRDRKSARPKEQQNQIIAMKKSRQEIY